MFVGMLEEIGEGEDRILFTYFKISGQSLDDRLVSLMAVEDVRGGKGKGVVIEKIVEDDVVNEAGKEEKLLLME
ncbi:hypothetical protein Tco_0432530 [Tanacetum coccineum]